MCLPFRIQNGSAAFEEAMAEMSAAAVSAYRDLVYGDPEFVSLFRAGDATRRDFSVADWLSARRGGRQLGASRICGPFPGCSPGRNRRFLLPGWYGVGSGLERGREAFGSEFLQAMDQEWPFFAATIANAEMALAKSDLGIAERYASLVGDAELRTGSGSEFGIEHERSTREILRLTGQNRLLDREPVLRRSIDRRNPYVDPISFVQVELLRRLRGDSGHDSTLRAILRTVNGIAGGLKSTG